MSNDAVMLNGDCLEILKTLPDDSVDSLVTDPPAGISFMGKAWDEDKGGRKQWIAWMSEVMTECKRVLKPGAHGLVWAIPRTSHWTATALEDAGFEIRDVVTHLFGSGFPKSMNISKAIDKQAGAEREVVGKSNRHNSGKFGEGYNISGGVPDITAPATPGAKQWQGWGTALKPASEHWILVRKPCSEETVAANVLRHGTGGINIDASRIGFSGGTERASQEKTKTAAGWTTGHEINEINKGRFPANLVLSHNPDCEEVGNCKPKLSSDLYYEAMSAPQVTSILSSQVDCQTYHDFYGELLHLVEVYGLNVIPSGADALALCGLYLSLVPHIRDRSDFDLPSNLGDFLAHSFEDGKGENKLVVEAYLDGNEHDRMRKSYLHSLDSSSNKVLNKNSGADTRNKTYHIPCTAVQLQILCFLNTYLAYYIQNNTNPCSVQALDAQASQEVSRFFYVAKASKKDKGEGNNHPTPKNTTLMSYLIKLITPPEGIVLDPFAGSGSTGVAAVKEGFAFIGIEKEAEYFTIAEKRLDYAG